MDLSLLSLIFSPLVFALILYTPFFKGNEALIRRASKGFASLHFLYSLCFLAIFEPLNTGISFFKEVTFFGADWIEPLGIKFLVGVDGLSILMVVLTSFIFLIALILSKRSITTNHRLYYSLVFFLMSAVLGVFCAQDMFLFFFFWELELIPMYFLIGLWGSSSAKKSAMKFVLYTFLGSMAMLVGMLLLHFNSAVDTGMLSSDMSLFNITSPEVSIGLQVIISVLLLVGFAVKLPIVPLHTWLPKAHVDAPTPISIILASVLLKMGAYGIIRFNMQILPEAFAQLVPFIGLLALVNIVYTAFIAFTQNDVKRIIAYSSISNMGIVLLGLCSLNLLGMSGAVFHMVAHGVISAGLFAVVGIIYLRTKTRDITQLGGLGAVMPRLMGFSLIIGFAAVGVPLLMGFVGEFLVFLGAFSSNAASTIILQLVAVSALIVLVCSAVYILRLIHKTFFGNLLEKWAKLPDLTNHETVTLTVLTLVIVLFGVFPMGLLKIVQPVLNNILLYLQF